MATIGKFSNTDFEQGTNYWSLAQGNGSAAIINNAANARTGSQYLKLVSGGTGGAYPTAMNTQDVAGTSTLYLPVVPGQIIQYGGWTYRESGTGVGWIALVAYDQNKANPVYANVPASATIGSWQWQTGTYKVPAGKYFLVFYLQVDPGVASAIRFDDVYCSPALDVQTYSGGQYTCQTSYLQYQSMTLKFNTFDFQLIDPTVIPALGDAITAIDPNIALNWSGTIAKINHMSVSEKGGHTFVTVSATNTNVAVAAVAPFDLSDGSQPMRNWITDPGFEDATFAGTQNFWDFGNPAEFSLDTVTFHGGAKSLLNTNTRQDSINGGVWWHNWNAGQPHMPGGTAEPGLLGTQDVFLVAPGESYTFSIWCKTNAGARAAHIKILWYKDLAGNLSDINTTSFGVGLPNGGDGPFGWTQDTVTAVAPQDARYAVLEVMSGNWGNILSVNQASLESGTTGWAVGSNCTLSQSSAQAYDGTHSLALTAVAAGNMWALTPGGVSGFPVVAGDQFTASAYFRAATTGRTCDVNINWFKSDGTRSAVKVTSYGTTITDTTTGWTQALVTDNAPSDAAFAEVVLDVNAPGAANEVHYVDAIGFTHGSNTNWPGLNAQTWWDDAFFGATAKYREAQHSYSKDQSGTNKVSSSYLTQQTGLWPLQSVAITNADLGLVNEDYTVTEVSMTWDIDHITPWQRITVGDPVVTMSVWLNSTNAGILPITTTKITDGAVTTPKVAAGAITADQIAAGAITADKLTATLVLASLIKAGAGVAHVEMDQNGLRAYDGSGNLVVNIPTDGVSPVTINANVLAQSLIVSGNSVFQGAKNEIALGSTLQLDSSLQNPAQAPSIAQTWNSVSLPVNSTYDLTSTTYSRVGLAYDSAGGAGGTTAVYWQATQNNGSKDDYLLELLTTDRSVNRAHDLTTDGFKTPLDVCRLGSYVYVLGIDGGTGSPSSWGGTGSATYSWNYSGPNTDNQVSTASYYTAPGAGTITSITIRCSSYSGTSTFYFCLWDTSGNLLANSAGTGLGTTLGDQTLSVSYKCTSGQGFYIGFWRTKSNYAQWGVNSSGSFDIQTVSGVSSLGGRAGCTGPYTCGDMRAFVTYTPDTRVWKVRRYVESTLALDTTYPSIAYLAAPTQPKMCSDGTNIFIVDRASGANIKWQKYDGTMATVGALVDSGYNPGASINAAFAGNADIGAWRMFVLTGGTVDDFDSTPTRQSTNEGFSTPAAAYGLTYDGTRFFSLPATGGVAVNLTSHSTWVWTTASSVYWVAYTWYDSQASHIHETMVSPYASITMSRRAQLVITTPSIPGTGGLDDPNNIRYYTLPNATQPATGAAKQQASQSATTLTMTTYNSGGAADPSSNNFPLGSAGQIQSEIGNTTIKGDGTATFGQGVSVAPANGLSPVISAGWGSVPVLIDRVVSPAGSSFNLGGTTLPTKYTHLLVKFLARSGANTSVSEQGFRFNNDSAANYTYDRFILAASYIRQSQGTTWQTYGRDWFMSAATASAGWTGGGEIYIPNYNDTHLSKVAKIDWFYWTLTGGLAANAYEWDSTICGYNSTAAITRLDFFELNSGGWATGSIFELWGLP